MSELVMQIREFMVPYLLSQIVSLCFLWAAIKNSSIARVGFFLMFLWAAMINLYTVLNTPDVYLEYAYFAVRPYREFINGWFSRYHILIVPLIAVGQFVIALAMLLRNPWFKFACIGAIVFLISIAPLLVGAAFPFSITVSIAAWLTFRNDSGDFLWRWNRRKAGHTFDSENQ